MNYQNQNLNSLLVKRTQELKEFFRENHGMNDLPSKKWAIAHYKFISQGRPVKYIFDTREDLIFILLSLKIIYNCSMQSVEEMIKLWELFNRTGNKSTFGVVLSFENNRFNLNLELNSTEANKMDNPLSFYNSNSKSA